MTIKRTIGKRIGLISALALLAACASVPALLATAQQTPAAASDTYIHAGRLLADPASGRVLTQQTILVRDGKIVSITAGYTSAPRGAKVVDLKSGFVLPGLIDSHVHITSEQGPDARLNQFMMTSSDGAIAGAGYALKTLQAGFTTVADLGADAEAILALRNGVAKGIIPGPRIITSAGAISVHGGHGDANGIPHDMAMLLRGPGVCSGADDCARATRERVRDGADLIKITATGGVLSNTAAGLGQQFTDDELKSIVQAAHAMGRRVTAHAHGADGINSFLRAGGDSIEHGTYANEESAQLFKANGAYLIPTLLAGDFVAREAAKPDTFLQPAQKAKALEAGPKMQDMLRRMHAAGVKIAFGTDTGVSAHGDNAQEFALMVGAGMTPLQTIQAATVNAAGHFSLTAEIGSIAAGKTADIIAVGGDPLTNVRELESVDFVMAKGKVYKQ
ncbi:MAG: Xaa-Pro dipeptidase [Rhodobacterales bacterium 12-64-8]|nr:MAG: Xaa-Pro dipeptidase [Rhodobacterales bacterium 12-64-8]OYX50483.1 MAG: Xaa-Pro dipeptidase [Alphaproteobacteria bacterium 32-64-14]